MGPILRDDSDKREGESVDGARFIEIDDGVEVEAGGSGPAHPTADLSPDAPDLVRVQKSRDRRPWSASMPPPRQPRSTSSVSLSARSREYIGRMASKSAILDPDVTKAIDEKDPERFCPSMGTKPKPKALKFGLRLSVVLTLSTIFVLVPQYKYGLWIYITVLMVSWFPAMDVASVTQKTIQRIQGTILGAVLGLVVGYMSSPIPTQAGQAIFLGCAVAITTFSYSFATIQWNQRFAPYSYAAVVGLMTFGIAYEPFYSDGGPGSWKKAALRVVNVVFGCVLGGLGAVLIYPKSTEGLLRDKLCNQIELAGKASESVLVWSADVFSGQKQPDFLEYRLSEFRRGRGLEDKDEAEEDEADIAAYAAYTKAIKDWKDAKSLFPLMDYDILGLFKRFRRRDRNSTNKKFRHDAAIALARAFRLQTTAVLLHSIARNDRGHDFTADQLDSFIRIGRLIGRLLKVPADDKSEECAMALLEELEQIRQYAVEESRAAAIDAEAALFGGGPSSRTITREALRIRLAKVDGGMPLGLYSSDSCMLLFFQLVEHLCLRALRLYYVSSHLVKGAVVSKDDSHQDVSIVNGGDDCDGD